MKTGLATLIACAWIGYASAQTSVTAEPMPPSIAASTSSMPATTLPAAGPQPRGVPVTPDSTACCRVVTETAVIVEIAEPLNSSKVHRGDYFTLRLADSVTLDGGVVIPAGTTGVGQVVDASAARSGGAPGKLVLAGRHLDYAGQQLQLHALKLGGKGTDRSNLSMGVAFAAGPFAMFIHGGQIEIPEGARANAKLAPNIGSPPSPTPPPSPTALPQQEH